MGCAVEEARALLAKIHALASRQRDEDPFKRRLVGANCLMLAERRGDEKANACSIGLCGSHVYVGRHEQERDNRAHPAISAMLHAVVLHRWPRASAAARRLKSG